MPQVKANGLSFEVESFGRETDPTILLVMGYSAQLTRWPISMCEGLVSRGYRVVRFDNRDVGLSEKLESLGRFNAMEAFAKVASGQPLAGPYLLKDMAADAAGILDAMKIKRAHVVGASMGGMITQMMALNHADKLLSMTSIMSSTGRPGLPAGTPEAMAVLTTPPANLERDTRIAHATKVWRTIGSEAPYAATDAELRAQAEQDIDRTPYYPDGMARQLVAILASGPRHELLKAVKTPTLVIHGVADPLVNVAAGKDTAACIPGARLKLIEHMGHDVPPKLVPVLVREIAAFASEVDAKAA